MIKKLLVVGAHSADFVWRAGGTIAKAVEQGGEVLNVALSYGERGESGELWKENPNRSVEEVKHIRHQQSESASQILGCTFKCLNWGDYPMTVNDARTEELAEIIRTFKPNAILTHTERDPFNPDHPLAFTTVLPRLSSVSIHQRGFVSNHTNPNFQILYPILLLISLLFLKKKLLQWRAWVRKVI